MHYKSDLQMLTGNWLQDASLTDSVSYVSVDDVLDIDLIIDWDTLTTAGGEVAASVKNSLAYTFKYT